jgi:hypothetical protein
MMSGWMKLGAGALRFMPIGATFKESGSPGVCIEGWAVVWAFVEPSKFGRRGIASLVIAFFPRRAGNGQCGSGCNAEFSDYVL